MDEKKETFIMNKNNFPVNVKYGDNTMRLSPRQRQKVDISKLDIENLPKKVIVIKK